MRRRDGLTTAELLIALALVGVLATAMLGLFVRLLSSSTKNSDQTAALQIAEDTLDQMARIAPSAWKTDVERVVYSHSSESNNPMRCRSVVRLINDQPGTPPDNVMGDLYRVDVYVSWWEERQGKSREGYGKQEVHLSRILYIENMKTF